MTDAPDPKDNESVHLNVISPSSPPICFRDIPISTSVAVLKQKIYQASPTHPTPNIQRLIYRGHVLTQSERTLKEVFSQELINASETISIHLITPPIQQQAQAVPQSNNPAPASIPAQPTGSPHPHVQQVTLSATFNGQPSQLQFPQQANIATPPSVNLQTPQSQVQTNAQLAGQQPTPAQPVGGQPAAVPPQWQAHLNAVQAQAQALFANQLAALQQHPTFAGQLPVMGPNGPMPPFPAPNSQPQNQQAPSANSAVRADRGSSGHPQHQHVSEEGRQPASNETRAGVLESRDPNNGNQAPAHGFRPGDPHPFHPASIQQQPGYRLRPQVSPAQPAIASQSGQLPGFQYTNQPPTFVPSASGIPAGYPSQRPIAYPTASFANLTPNYPPISNFDTNLSEAQRSGPPAVYLLSSPTGPQALLVSPSGLFSTPWLLPRPVGVNPLTQSHLHQTIAPFSPSAGNLATASASSTSAPAMNQAVQPRATGQHARLPGAPLIPEPVPNPEQRDVGRLAAQISSHIWMLVRLFGFIWFFSHGASTSRTVMLCIVGTLVFFGQVGMFQGVWQGIRRRADGILHHAGPGQVDQTNAHASTNAASAGTSSTPEQTAERLLAERRRQEGNAGRQMIRRCERAAMLFFGSLAPGLAERHIQARNEAESARQREMQERELREKREEEARKSAAAGATEAKALNEKSQVSPDNQRREGQAQAPLIEV